MGGGISVAHTKGTVHERGNGGGDTQGDFRERRPPRTGHEGWRPGTPAPPCPT